VLAPAAMATEVMLPLKRPVALMSNRPAAEVEVRLTVVGPGPALTGLPKASCNWTVITAEAAPGAVILAGVVKPTKVEYSDGQRIVGQTDSLTTYISTNWASDNPVPALKLTFGKAGTAKDEAASH